MIADDLAILRRQLCERFDLEELRTLCADLGVDFDDLRGEGKTAKAREFVALMQRRGQLDRLKQVVEQRGSILESIDGRYVAFLRRQYGHVPLGGIAPRVQGRALSIPLAELFVPLQAELDAPLQTQFVMSGVRGFQAIHSPDPRLVGLDGITAEPHVVILGEPGAGKSTLLRWMIAQTLGSTDNPKVHSLAVNVLPIFIRLTNFATVLERQPGIGLAQYIREWHLPEYRALFERLLANDQGWLLLDGLDEVADPRRRREVRNAIEAFAAQFSDFHIIVTSRIVGYRSAQIATGFRHFTLQPFGSEEIAHFVRNWYRAVYRLVEGVSDDFELERRANRLLEGLMDKYQVFQLAGTPLLLAIIALMDWKGKEIPKRRVELYEVAAETLLEDWPAEHGRPIEDRLDMSEMLEVLAPLAQHMVEMGLTEAIRLDELKPRVVNLIQGASGCSEQEARDLGGAWLDFLSEHSGLLIDVGVDEFHRPIYAFLHLSFAEYFSGRALAKQWHEGSIDLSRYVNDPRWREVVLLMAGHVAMQSVADGTRLVDELSSLKPPHHDVLHQSLVLAAACLADDVSVASSLRAKILDELIPLWYSGTFGLLHSKLFRILAAMRGTDSAPHVVERIISLLDDDHAWVRSSVLELLGKLGRSSEPALKARLLNALRDPSVDVQRAAIRSLDALGLVRDSDVGAALLQALYHPNGGIRARAALALSPIVEYERDVQITLLNILAQDDDIAVRQLAARILGTLRQPGDEVVGGMLAASQDPNGAVRKEAATGFIHWGEDSRQRLIAALRRTLNDVDTDERRRAVKVIVDVGAVFPVETTELLLEAAEGDDNLFVKAAIIRSLGSLPTTDNRVTDLLVGALADRNRAVRRNAALALKQLSIRSSMISLGLAQALKDSDVSVRKFAAEALVECGTPELDVVGALEEALDDANQFVRLSAACALLEIGAKSVKAYETLFVLLRSANSEIRRRTARRVRETIQYIDSSVTRILIDLVSDDSRDVREEALLALAELGYRATPTVVAACRMAMHDKYHLIRMCAANALGKLRQSDEATINDLLSALTDSDTRVRLAACEALIALGEGPARAAIIESVRTFLDEHTRSEDALNTLWGLVVGE